MQGEISYDGCDPGYGESAMFRHKPYSDRKAVNFSGTLNGVFRPFANEVNGAVCYAGGVSGSVYMISWSRSS
ncbi:hypothetical protein [Rhizobium sp. CSW-27]|uniref:hypothetical protein n=1 Tax=Rhizobium sp. CSW-27 TaxID=2839985 RepID=UPI001C02CE8E|nr:hypothetical protein [Rhizobium sp. CSW-27]MBT9372283.1 hypothetical protein [Rhizobium sp. CSW-27]